MPVVARNIEPLIPLVSEMKEHLESMRKCYICLPPLIEREHRAIKSGIFTEVRAICEEKEILTQTIESDFEAITRTGEKIGRITEKNVSSLTELGAVMSELLDSVSQDSSLASQVLRHVAQALEKSAAELEETARQVKPIIESNRDLVTKLMTSYSQSYRFWQEIQEQVSSSYTPDGVQKAIGRVSGFRARA